MTLAPACLWAQMNMNMTDMNPASMYLMKLASGTSTNPAGWNMPMAMTHTRKWNLMFMGLGFLSDIQQSGPRGRDKLYSTNWVMASAEHRIGKNGAFQAEVMLSLEPATITDRRYPLLFQTGETAYGTPLVDAQHPHNFVMALGFHYVRRVAGNTIDLYFAPVGDPALGPVAYPHRASAMELPEAPISHHLQDSTHISDEVVTVAIRHDQFKLEASGFHGAEPGENRWTIQTGAIDSWSTRLWFFPSKSWAAQVSVGRLAHPEALEPGNQLRATASISYTRGGWSTSLIWGRTHSTATYRNLNSYLVETVLPVTRRNFLSGRFELADKDELFEIYRGTFRIAAYTVGYTRDVAEFRHADAGIGANVTAYETPAAIQPFYSAHPVGGNLFLRVRLK